MYSGVIILIKGGIILKKNVAAIACASALLIALSACGTPAEQNEGNTTPTPAIVSPAQEPTAVPSTEPGQPQNDIFAQFQAALDSAGYTYETVVMGAELVGAEQGMKYKIGDGSIELYRFDEDSESYKKAAEDNALTLEGFGAFPATVKNGFAILINDLPDSESEILSMFDGLK